MKKDSYRILHLADTHIHNTKYHDEYRDVFSRIYKKARELQPDYIFHCGDIAHTKTQLSPEYFELGSEFLKNLADIAPTYIILGNHDLVQSNLERQDAITPIVQALNHKNLNLLKYSTELSLNNDITLNVMSIVDEDKWMPISDNNKINIAIYHGSVSGVETESGYILEHGDVDISLFQDFDYALLGDIHRTNQKLDREGRIRYPGNTVSFTYADTDDKGFLLWDIQTKDDFTVKHFSFANPKPFVTIELNNDGSLPNVQIPANSRLRLVSHNHIPSKDIKSTIDKAKSISEPYSLVVQNKPGRSLSAKQVSGEYNNENLRDGAIQEKLIADFLKDYNLEKQTLEKIFELNRYYSSLVEQSEEIARNVKWSPKTLRWSNLFNYGEDNEINFKNITGIVGNFGGNFQGKSSIWESFLWCVFNSISKNVRKNVDIINQNRDTGFASVEIQIDNKLYKITREATKYVKKLHGEETIEAKTSVDFQSEDLVTGEIENLNGLSRNDTDANIRKVFGTIDDFLLTSMTSQMGSLQFINEGSTKRKEIFSKFLDLEIFDKKYKLIKADSAVTKGELKKLEERDFSNEILETEKELFLTEQEFEQVENEHKTKKQEALDLNDELVSLRLLSSNTKQEIIDINKVEADITKKEKSILALSEENRESNIKIEKAKTKLEDLEKQLLDLDKEKIKNDNQKLNLLEKSLIQVSALIDNLESQIKAKNKKISILQTVPCENNYPTCRFLLDANKEKQTIPESVEELNSQKNKKQELDSETKELHGSVEMLEFFEKLEKDKNTLEKAISQVSLRVEKNKNSISLLTSSLEDLQEQKDNFYKNEEEQTKILNFLLEKEKLEKSIKEKKQEIDFLESQKIKLSTKKGVLQQKIKGAEEQKQELDIIREKYSVYEMLLKCMHSNGIVYDIIKKKLPQVNQEMNDVLLDIVPFEVFFDDDGKKLDLFIKHPKYEARPLELGSGAEKSIASIAIRLALIKSSSLPVSDIKILDEPATALDEENMAGFTKILSMLKSNFKTIILISHLETLKDVVDKQIIIDKVDGFAKVNI